MLKKTGKNLKIDQGLKMSNKKDILTVEDTRVDLFGEKPKISLVINP